MDSFYNFNLQYFITRALDDMGYNTPTPIQAATLNEIQNKTDVIGQASTGTGKTLAFILPTLNILSNKKELQSLIICPTRELAMQITNEYNKILKYNKDINIVTLYGGEPRHIQKGKVQRQKPQVIVGTPGRIIDFINSKVIDINKINSITLDEADEMLNMGFREDIENILENVKSEKQMLLFSATLPKEIVNLANTFMNNAKHIKVDGHNLSKLNIEQTYYIVSYQNKIDLLIRLLDFYNSHSSIVFCNTKSEVDKVVSRLQEEDYIVDGLHGDLKQEQRDRVMNGFRKKSIDILVASDVAARGIDVDNIEFVFNYDLPQENETYLHRIGRTGRAGKSGYSITFVTPKEERKLNSLIKFTKTDIEQAKVPSLRSVRRKAMLDILDRANNISTTSDLTEKLVDKLYEYNNDKDVIITNLVELLISTNTRNYKDLKREEFVSNVRGDKSDKKKKDFTKGRAKLVCNIKRSRDYNKYDLLDFLSKSTRLSKNRFNNVDIGNKYTEFYVEKKSVSEIIRKTESKEFNGTKIKYIQK